ncbi:MAG: tetratricopeptide repeat protein [Phaeodactylibacter sp.]|nr:tetratricopeptide repeat protein [Phaeodactylibacter sp.]
MEDLDYIYRHFTAGLSAEERKTFDARLQSDSSFRTQVSDYQLIFEGFRGMRQERFFQEARGWKGELLADSRIGDVEAFRAYLSGAMPESEKAAFEARLGQDPALAARLEEYRLLLAGLKAMRAEAFYRQAEAWAKELEMAPPAQAKKPAVKFLWPRAVRYAAAAVLVLALAFAGMKYYALSNYSTDALIAQNYHPRNTPATLSGREDLFREGFNAYSEKDFPAAIAFFSRIPEENPRYAEAQLFLGYACFESGRYPAAVQAFQRAADAHDQRFSENAEWHLLLSRFRENPASPAFASLLDKLARDPQHSFHDEALRLKASLGSFWRKLAG